MSRDFKIIKALKITISHVRNYLNISIEPPEIWSIKRVRAALRGYRILRSKGQNTFLKNIGEQLTETKVGSGDVLFNSSIMPFSNEIADISYRQYLLLNLVGTRLSASVLAHLSDGKPLTAPLPTDWIKVLQKNDLNIDLFNSRLIFFLFAIKQFCIAMVYFFAYLVSNILSLIKCQEKNNGDFVYFIKLQSDCLPPKDGSFQFNIVEWYLNWQDKSKKIKEIRHDLRGSDYMHKDFLIRYSPLLPRINGISGFLHFVFWGIRSLIISFYYLIIGRLQYAIFLREMQKAKIFELADRSSIAKEYLHNNLDMDYRPLWTYAAEKQGSKIILYNWSAGFQDFLGPQGYPPTVVGEKIQNWPVVLQWSLPFAQYLKSVVSPKTEVKVVSPIYYCDTTPESYRKLGKPVIVLFDVTPQKNYFHDILTPYVEYRTYPIGKKFLEDIYEAALDNGFDILWKRKRNFNSNHNRGYINFSNKFINRPGVIDVNPRISAFRLVQEANGVISMPFTSTAIVADYFKKPSIYYDPTGFLHKEDRGAQGIPLILGKEELNNWIRSL